jgi:hypothetical protein
MISIGGPMKSGSRWKRGPSPFNQYSREPDDAETRRPGEGIGASVGAKPVAGWSVCGEQRPSKIRGEFDEEISASLPADLVIPRRLQLLPQVLNEWFEKDMPTALGPRPDPELVYKQVEAMENK